MTRTLLTALAMALVAALCSRTSATAAPRYRAVCVPVYVEGAGTARICPPARRR